MSTPADNLGDHITSRSAAAVRRHAARLHATAVADDDTIELVGEYQESVATIHRDTDGRWVHATWSDRQMQYTGHSPDGVAAMGSASYCFTYGRTLRALRRLGLPSYSSPAAALRHIEAQ